MNIHTIITAVILFTIPCYASLNFNFEDFKKADKYKRLKGNGMEYILKGVEIHKKHPKIATSLHIKEYIPFIKETQITFKNEVKAGYFSEEVCNYFSKIKKEINTKIKEKSLKREDSLLFHYKVACLRSKNTQNKKEFNDDLPISSIYLKNKCVIPCCLKNPLMDYVPIVVGILFNIYPMAMKNYQKKDWNPQTFMYFVHGGEYSIEDLLKHDYKHLHVFETLMGNKWSIAQPILQKTLINALQSKEEKIFKESVASLFIMLHETLIPLEFLNLNEKESFDIFHDMIDGAKLILAPQEQSQKEILEYARFFGDMYGLLHDYAGIEFKSHPKTDLPAYYHEFIDVSSKLLDRFYEYHADSFK